MKDRWAKRRELKRLLDQVIPCGVQHTGWPCNSCFHSLKIGMTDDQVHRCWGATLVLRGDYRPEAIVPMMSDSEMSKCIDDLLACLRQKVEVREK